jgi:MscS family membrane protein
VKDSELFYDKVKHLPYKPGCVGALYEQVIASGGFIVPGDFVKMLPGWMKVRIFGQSLWQWVGMALYFVTGLVSVFMVRRGGCAVLALLDEKAGWSLGDIIGGLILPIALVLFARTGLWFTVYGLHFLQADVYVPIAFVFLSIAYFGTIWLVGALLSRAAALVIALGGFETGGMHAPLIRVCFDVVTFVIVIGTALNLGARLGLPTYSLVTGLGIGGLAVALAGRETLSNLIGTVMILLDQPFKLGDFIKQGDGDRGTVTEIGLRSTRIRTRDGILVSIPNANIANMRIVNESAPVSEARLHLPVGAAYGSPIKEVEAALLNACTQCEYVTSAPPPSVRLVRFGDSALDFELLVWVTRPEYRGRATDRINRAIVDEFLLRGIEMPFPQRDIRIRRDSA